MKRRGPGRDSGRDGDGRGSRRDPSRSGTLTSPSDRLKGGFVLLVAISGAMMGIQASTSPVTVGLATVAGLVAGGLLLWYLDWILT